MKTRIYYPRIINFLFVLFLVFQVSSAQSEDLKDSLYNPGVLKSTDSSLVIKVGDAAPDFSLPDLKGGKVSLGDFKSKQNVVLSFVPAAWTPVCSQQWPGYNLVKEIFDENNATLIGISVDNIPTLHAWTRQMGNLWFHVASDFWPHGEIARKYGILRSDGVSERATVVIDKHGVVRYVEVHDINAIPRLEDLVKELNKLPK
ncbi:MAG: peroxiredoxin [Desulfomonilaceae bacterium]